jgi:hypothetical protein
MVRDATRIDHVELLRTTPLCCIDGRATRPVIGSPGGTAGELVRVLGAVEQITGKPVEDPAVDDLLEHLLERWGPIYLHTDRDAALRWLDAAGIVSSSESAALSLLDAPPHALREDLLRTAAESAHVGCGHLRLLATGVDTAVRPALVGAVTRAFLRAHWAGVGHTILDVLVGEHEECEVRVVHSCAPDRPWGEARALVPCATEPRFVVHPDAARWLRRQICRFAVDRGMADDERALVEVAESLYEQHLQLTLDELAKGLPIHVDRPTCHRH